MRGCVGGGNASQCTEHRSQLSAYLLSNRLQSPVPSELFNTPKASVFSLRVRLSGQSPRSQGLKLLGPNAIAQSAVHNAMQCVPVRSSHEDGRALQRHQMLDGSSGGRSRAPLRD